MIKTHKRFGDLIERIYGNSLNVDLLEALASGLVAGAVLTFLKLIANLNISVPGALASVALPTVCLYIVTALLLNRLWQGDLRLFVPSWFLLPVLGSALAVILYMIPALLSGWSDPFTDKTSIAAYLLSRLRLARTPFFLLNLLTWPVALTVHLFGPAVKWVRAQRSPAGVRSDGI